MDKREYQVGITIIEGRYLKGKDYNGTSDPYVKISCAGLDPQVTETKYNNVNPVFNKQFTIKNIQLNQYELETLEMIVEVFDRNSLKTDELIGGFSIGLSTMHRSLNHEFYNQWVELSHQEFPQECQGYLRFSSYIVGPNDRPPSHAQDEEIDRQEKNDEYLLQGKSEEQKLNIMNKKQGLKQLWEPDMIKKSYQLNINIIKAESLPQCEANGRVNSFVTVRAGGFFLQSRTVEKNHNPLYNSRLSFPIRLPILNDKVVLKMWSQGSGQFIANIPEFPSGSDQFNISKLISKDGKIKAQWLNLYGILPSEYKKWFTKKNFQKKEGSQFLGRILVSMNINPHDNPQLISTSGNPQKEPSSGTFYLWVDTYELVNCERGGGKDLSIVATLGNEKTKPFKARSYNEKNSSYSWGSKFMIKPLIVSQYPTDLRQVPDVIINVIVNSVMGEERIGYIRIPVVECRKREANPQWYRLKSPYNDGTCPGIILMNVQYVWEGADIQRFPKQRSVEGSYKIYAQILRGFELAPSIPEDQLNTKVEIKIGNQTVQKNKYLTEIIGHGRFPKWEETIVKEILIEKNLNFAADMRVVVLNKTREQYWEKKKEYKVEEKDSKNEIIGEFSVPIASIQKYFDKPQFFNVIGTDNKLEGQILARFFLKEIDKKKKHYDTKDVENKFQLIKELGFKVNIYVSVFGIRNLIREAKKPILKLKLTGLDEVHIIKQQEFGRNDMRTKNPNFGQIKVFQNVELPVEPLLWPLLQIELQEEKQGALADGCENCYTTMTLFEFAQFLSEQEKEFSKAQINRNQNKINIVQKQIDPEKYFQQKQKTKLKFADDQDAEEPEMGPIGSDEDNEGEFDIVNNGGMDIKEYYEDEDIEKYLQSSSDDSEVNEDDIKINMNKERGKSEKNIEEEKKKDVPSEKVELKKNQVDLERGVYPDGVEVDFRNLVEINCTKKMKQKEEKLRIREIREREQEIEELKLKMAETKKKIKKDHYRKEIIDIKNEIQELEEERMDEKKFWGYQQHDDEEEQYDRDVLKEGTMDQQLKLPYQEFPLFQAQSGWTMWGKLKTTQFGGILRSGVRTGARLKAAIRIIEVEDDSQVELQSEQEQQPQNLPGTTAGGPDEPDIVEEEEGDEEEQKLQNNEEKQRQQLMSNYKSVTIIEIHTQYPFDVTKQKFLDFLLKQGQRYKVRVVILRCQNLTAIDSYLDIKSRIAGFSALCSADPFPVVQIGDGENNQRGQQVKKYNERENEVKQNLNPIFNRVYQFDAEFPQDWKLSIDIYDKGGMLSSDRLIGGTEIDLEDRLYGQFRKQVSAGLEIYKKELNSKLKKLQKKVPPNRKKEEIVKGKIENIVKQEAQLSQIEQRLSAVEFRELRHPQKQQAQGIIEMWVDVFTQEEDRKIKIPKLRSLNKEEYEIRLIIWETNNIPRLNSDTVDIYVKATFDPTGWSKDIVEKRTDTHYGSSNGYGIFNYRMKFNLVTPCEFPRLMFSVYDAKIFADEAIGTVVLEMEDTVKTLMKEGRVDIKPLYLGFTHPNKREEKRGDVYFEMTIISKQEADGKPVGEAQNDPNDGPRLEKPEIGRGAKDIISGKIYDISKISMPKVNLFRNMMIIGIVAGVIIVVLIVIMFLK